MKIRRKTLSLIKTWTIRAGIFSLAALLVYGYWGSDVVRITTYDVKGLDEDVRQVVISRLEEASLGRSYYIFPNNKMFTYSSSKIIEVIRNTASDVGSIAIRPVGLHTLRITTTTLSPLLRVDEREALTEEGILFVTRKDIQQLPSIAIASSTRENVKIDGLVFTRMNVGGRSVDTFFLREITTFAGKVSSVIFPVTDMFVDDNGDVSLRNASGTSKVIFSKDTDTRKAWTTLVSAIDTDPLKSELAKNKDKLLYLDVRYGNKVFYKFNTTASQNDHEAGIIDNHVKTSSTTFQETR